MATMATIGGQGSPKMKPSALRRYLIEIGSQSLYDNSDNAFQFFIGLKGQKIPEMLFYAATNDGEYIHELFPEITSDELKYLSNNHETTYYSKARAEFSARYHGTLHGDPDQDGNESEESLGISDHQHDSSHHIHSGSNQTVDPYFDVWQAGADHDSDHSDHDPNHSDHSGHSDHSDDGEADSESESGSESFIDANHLLGMDRPESDSDSEDIGVVSTNHSSKLPTFLKKIKKGPYSHPPNRTCGRTFLKHEMVYRCEECGFDETCVLCMYCFNPKDHVDHNVFMYPCSSDTGGICDCGDPEAFSNIHCKCQEGSSTNEEESLPPRFRSALRNTIEVVLDYIIDVANIDPLTLPWVKHMCRDLHSIEEISNRCSLLVEKYGIQDRNSLNDWKLILWNDEIHNYPQTERVITEALLLTPPEAREMAEKVDRGGYHVVLEKSSPEALFKAQAVLELEGLVTTIVSGRDYRREVISHNCVKWLSLTVQHGGNSFREEARSIICELLLEPGYKLASEFPLTYGTSGGLESICYDQSLLYHNEIPRMEQTRFKPGVCEFEIWDDEPLKLLISGDENRPYLNSRLQFLAIFEKRFNKVMRTELNSMLPPILMFDMSKRVEFSSQLLEIYPLLLTSLTMADREHDLSFLSSISHQIFTCPTSVTSALKLSASQPEGMLGHILGPLIILLERRASKFDETLGYPVFKQFAEDNARGVQVNKIIESGILIVKRVFTVCNIKDLDAHFMTKNNVSMILMFLRYFQGYWGIKKKYGEHVEREVLDFVIHLTISIPILLVAKHVAELIASSLHPEHGIDIILKYLMNASVTFKSDEVVSYRVSTEKTSFVNPINSLLSHLVELVGFKVAYPVIKAQTQPFVRVSDFSLRSIVLASQIRIGFWVRNGSSVSRQGTIYTSLMGRSTFTRDFHLQQTVAIMGKPAETFMNFLDRWELSDWFNGTSKYSSTIYEDRINSIMLEFIIFIFNIITDRSSFSHESEESRVKLKIRKFICSILSTEPKGYTKLKQKVESFFGKNVPFEEVLKEVSNYQPPTGLNDSGMFRLKANLFENVNPISLYLDGSDFLTVYLSLVSHAARQRGIQEDEVVITPKFEMSDLQEVNESISKFTKTKEFVKFVYKLLQICIDTSDETFILPLLHLIHAVLIDDTSIHGEDYLSPYFVNIPVSDLLLTVIESNKSAQIAKKAEFLLQFLTSKDPSVVESLNDCFGPEHVAKFLRKSTESESESDKRKRMAEERKQKIMKKFAKQRESFLEKNEDLLKSMGKTEAIDQEARNCVLCGEEEMAKKQFGMLGTFNPHQFWNLPFKADYSHVQVAFKDWDDQSLRNGKNDYGKGFHGFQDQTIFKNDNPVFVVSTCGHGMHRECYEAYRRQLTITDIPCPLCKVSSNMLIPSPPPNNKEVEYLGLDEDPIHSKYNQITSSVGVNKCEKLVEYFVHPNQREETIRSLIDSHLQFFAGKPFFDEYADKFLLILEVFSSLMANTIQMHEITSRVEGNSSYSNFLSSFPNSATWIIKSLIVYRSLFYVARDRIPNMKYSRNMQDSFSKFWDKHSLSGISSEVIYLYFQTDESFKTLCRFGYSKLFATTLYSLMLRVNMGGEEYASLFNSNGHQISEETSKELQSLISRHTKSFAGYENPEFLNSLFFSIERSMLSFLRVMVIFKDMLTSKVRHDNTYESIPDLRNLEDEIASQDYEACSDVLTQKLGVPTLKQLVQILAKNEDDKYSLERSIFSNVIGAKIPKFYEDGILCIDFPGVSKFIELPTDYNACVSSALTTAHDFSVCLLCGTILRKGRFNERTHIPACCRTHTSVFFHPRTNKLQVYSFLGSVGPIQAPVDAPYLTEFGEVRKQGKATINNMRYSHLNQLWLNKGLFQLLSRLIFTTDPRMTQEREFAFEEEEEDLDDIITSVDDIEW